MSVNVQEVKSQVVLLGWNRDFTETFPVEEYEEERNSLMDGKSLMGQWSVGRNRRIESGTPCVLVTQGQRFPRGIVAWGIITSEPWVGEHWREPDKTTNYVAIEWKQLLPLDDVIPVSDLIKAVPEGPWEKGFQQSGMSLRGDAAQNLLQFLDFRSPENEEPGPGELLGKHFKEGSVRTVRMNRYERDPNARRAALQHHGSRCAVCDFEPSRVYGPDVGPRIIHVHHIVPIATIGEEYELDPIEDLVPLCPNCHNAIHKLDPVPTPSEFRAQIVMQR